MARPKKAQTKTETHADALDKLLKEIDPEVILAGSLGALAAYGGVTPPLTRILATFDDIMGDLTKSGVHLPSVTPVSGDEATKGANDAINSFFNILKLASPASWVTGVPDPVQAVTDVWTIGSPLLWVLNPFGSAWGVGGSGGGGGGTEKDRATQIQMRGLMASGALEAMMMMTLMKNPGTIVAIGEAVKGIAGAMKPSIV